MKYLIALKMTMILLFIFINVNNCETYLNANRKGINNTYHWNTNNIHYRVHQDGAQDNGLDYNATLALIQNAYSTWENVTTSNISFTYDGSTSNSYSKYDGINGHYWVYPPQEYFIKDSYFYDDPDKPGVQGASAITIFEFDNNYIVDADILYNGLKEWKGTDYMTWWNEVESVAIHEIGHTLGIGHADPSIIPNPVMCNGAAPSSDRHTLKFDDLEAVSFLYGGNIIDNETFSGDNYFNWDINVISGKTITFNSGSFVYFDEGTGLLINGTLNAIGNSSNGITFNRSGGSGTWGGIQFNSGSTGSLDYCTITNASTGIYCYNSSPSIRHSTLDYNGIGLSCNEYSSPVLVGNNIRNNSSYGLRTNNYSSPNLTDNGYPGSNVIRNNSTGIFTTYNSSPNLNGYMTYGNSVFNNSSYEIMAYYYCTVNADRVFWNAVPPPGSEFATIGSTINRNYPLSTNPNPNRSIIEKGEPVNFIASSETNLYDIPTDDFSLALERQREKRYDEAIALFLKVFMKNKDELVGKYALTKIEECFTQSGRKDYLQFSEKEIKPNITVGNETYVIALELEAHQMVNAEEYTGAINNLTTILTKYNLNENIEKNTLFTLGSFYTLFSNNKTDADNYYNTLKTKYPEDDLVSQIEIIKGMGESNLENRKIVLPNPEIKSESINKNAEISISNYPNPFNPETTIEYNLPTEGNVKLEVYNSLGQLVNVLIEGNQSAGRQRVTWNGKDSFGSSVASGIYFYRIKTNSFTHVKKMILMK